MNLARAELSIPDHFKKLVSDAVSRSLEEKPIIYTHSEPDTSTPEVFADDPYPTWGVVIIGNMFQGTAIATPYVSAMSRLTPVNLVQQTTLGWSGFSGAVFGNPILKSQISKVSTDDSVYQSCNIVGLCDVNAVTAGSAVGTVSATSVIPYSNIYPVLPINVEAPSTSQKALALVQGWLEDSSEYDKEVWPKVKASLEKNRLSDRKLFND